ncbi:MAG TPA: tetratricopeptide repeat protein [Longimicrobiaceae bacterium]
MQVHPRYPVASETGAQVIVVEAERGAARRGVLQQWLADAGAAGASSTWLLPCDVVESGVWAGPNHWLEAVLPGVRERAPELFRAHDSEWLAVLPRLRREVRPRYVPLTEAVAVDESVRNYAMDRAYRIGSGLVDFFTKWHVETGGGRWVVACDDFDRVGALAGRFFRELVRRRGQQLDLVLVLAVDPGMGDEVAEGFAWHGEPTRVSLELPTEPEVAVDREDAARRLAALEEQVGGDTIELLVSLPELIRLAWRAGDEPRAVRWHSVALGMYNHLGYYADALRHAPPVHASLAAYDPSQHVHSRWNLVGNLFGTYQANGQAEKARAIIEEVLATSTSADERTRAWYVMSMLHVRYLQEQNPEEGERCIMNALAELEHADLPAAEKHFMRVFALNGLALVRVRQGRPEDALELTLSNSAHLDEHLPPERHRLHRSVLHYNAGQVYARTGAHEDAIRSFSTAMAMDPDYSEYYNDRGNSYLKLRRYEEAARDYLQAIDCSPPYPEVWANLGYCYSFMGRTAEAEQAFSRALDLDPSRAGAQVGRAQARTAMGMREEALADYDAVLERDASNPLTFANRATLRFELGRVDDALEDLDRAVALAPHSEMLRRNRSFALEALGRREEAAADLEEYLRLRPDAADREEVERRLALLQCALEPA